MLEYKISCWYSTASASATVWDYVCHRTHQEALPYFVTHFICCITANAT